MGLFDKRKKASKRTPSVLPEEIALQKRLEEQDKQHKAILDAENRFKNTGDIDALINFWENIWKTGGLRFNGSKWAFRLPDLYIQTQQYDKALKILDRLEKSQYKDKARAYKEKIMDRKKRLNINR